MCLDDTNKRVSIMLILSWNAQFSIPVIPYSIISQTGAAPCHLLRRLSALSTLRNPPNLHHSISYFPLKYLPTYEWFFSIEFWNFYCEIFLREGIEKLHINTKTNNWTVNCDRNHKFIVLEYFRGYIIVTHFNREYVWIPVTISI